MNTKGSGLAREFYGRTMAEVADGWVTEPMPLSAVGANRLINRRLRLLKIMGAARRRSASSMILWHRA